MMDNNINQEMADMNIQPPCEGETRLVEESSDNLSVDSEKSCNKYKLTDSLKEKIRDMPDVLEFINLLQKYIEKQRRHLRKIKAKLKRTKSLKEIGIQTENDSLREQDTAESKPEANEVESTEQGSKTLADEIKEAAELAMQHSGFVYEETSGMYYDYNTGYYYNAEYGLYYDGNTGTYLQYNQETQKYEFHSQVTLPQEQPQENQPSSENSKQRNVKHKKKKTENRKALKRRRIEKKDAEEASDLEEGECSDSIEESDESEAEATNSDSSDLSKQWPPCMRIIVEETSLPDIKVGSLSIITFEGGTLGREGDHSILLPDVNVSKHHLKFTFDKDSSKYLVTDLGSRNGTLLNGKRISPSKQESEPVEVVHGSKIQVGCSVLLCHIHDGNQTCGHCEPGLLQNAAETRPLRRLSKSSKSEKHKTELQNLRRKFGVGDLEDPSKLPSGYTDRAQKRRDTVGSQNPHEKTQVTSIDESISKQNKGFKLLSKMGWKEGQSLGKEGQGIAEPVKLVSNPGTVGIGCSTPGAESTFAEANRETVWKKVQDRYDKLPDTNTAFDDLD